MPSPLPTELRTGDLAIATRDLTKEYRDVTAVSHLALQVPDGAVYLLVGPNGAGKSTTIKILLDLVEPTSGSTTVFGMDSQANGALVRANVGYVPEQLEWGHAWMRVGRLLEHHASYFPTWDREYATRLFKSFDLQLDRKLGKLSKGQGRRVHLAMALAHRPPLLVLDEPTDGLDPVMRDEAMGVLAEHLADSPTTVLLCTHHVSEFEQFADHIGVLRNGELRAQLPLLDLRRGLRRYRADLTPAWSGATLFGDRVVRRATTARDLDWIIWGDEAEVSARLSAAGAVVRDSIALSLDDATLALLGQRTTPTHSSPSAADRELTAMEAAS